jgi:hypothetical protein
LPVRKATLARRFAAAILGDPAKIEQDDLSLEQNQAIVADREKWPANDCIHSGKEAALSMAKALAACVPAQAAAK